MIRLASLQKIKIPTFTHPYPSGNWAVNLYYIPNPFNSVNVKVTLKCYQNNSGVESDHFIMCDNFVSWSNSLILGYYTFITESTIILKIGKSVEVSNSNAIDITAFIEKLD